MTPEQLDVACDLLIEHGATPEEVAAMRAAATGDLQVRVAVAVREALVRALDRAGRQASTLERMDYHHSIDTIGRVDLTPIIDRFSSPKGEGR